MTGVSQDQGGGNREAICLHHKVTEHEPWSAPALAKHNTAAFLSRQRDKQNCHTIHCVDVISRINSFDPKSYFITLELEISQSLSQLCSESVWNNEIIMRVLAICSVVTGN